MVGKDFNRHGMKDCFWIEVVTPAGEKLGLRHKKTKTTLVILTWISELVWYWYIAADKEKPRESWALSTSALPSLLLPGWLTNIIITSVTFSSISLLKAILVLTSYSPKCLLAVRNCFWIKFFGRKMELVLGWSAEWQTITVPLSCLWCKLQCKCFPTPDADVFGDLFQVKCTGFRKIIVTKGKWGSFLICGWKKKKNSWLIVSKGDTFRL